MNNIFVGSLSSKTSEEELRREFERFGEVSSAKIILDRETLKSRGFAFVEMPNKDQASAAIAGLNGKELAGQTLKVNEARPREPQGGQGGEHSRGSVLARGRSDGNRFSSGNRGNSAPDQKGTDIYDTKNRSGGGIRKQCRGRGGSGGRTGGGRRPH